MADVMTIRDTVARAKGEGLNVSEHAVRTWVKEGKIPVIRAGVKQLIYYPNFINFLTCGGREGMN